MNTNRHLTDELAQSLVDGLLPDAQREACQAHAAACQGCQLLVESYRALGDALEGLESPPPPPDFTDAVMARIDARERTRAWERRLVFGILGAAACLAAVLAAVAGLNAWAPALSRASDRLGELATALAVGGEVLAPVLRALRLEIAVGCFAVGLPLLFALSRLVPRRAEAAA